MSPNRLAHLKPFRTLATLLLLLVVLLLAPAQSQNAPATPASPASPVQPNPGDSPPPPQTPASPATPVPDTGLAMQDQAPPGSQPQSPQQPKTDENSQPESRITKGQAKELFREVDEILRFASDDTGLPIKQKVKRNLITREAVEKYVNKRMKDDKDAARLEQSRLVLEKFGLLPPGYDLHAEFLRLLGEQVAAYYDPKSKSINLLDWVQPDMQKPVLAHELTHALQDQKIDLEKWELAGAKDDRALPDQQEYVVEEEQAARQCVAEGQAMIVLLDYSLAPMGKNVVTAPDIVDAMRASMADSKDSPVFAAAPMFLRESLMMPYTFGLDFVRTVLVNKGKDAAFGGMLENPPIDTRQVMQPETYLLHQEVEALHVPDLDQLVAPNYERFDFGGMGEFDIYLLARQYGGADPKNYYTHWRGGYYFAAHAKAAPKNQIAMLYFSRWDSPEAARAFAKLYAHYLPRRYKRVMRRPTGSSPGAEDVIAFDTDEGKATIEVHDNDLLVLEGFDETASNRARDVLFYNMSLPDSPAKSSH